MTAHHCTLGPCPRCGQKLNCIYCSPCDRCGDTVHLRIPPPAAFMRPEAPPVFEAPIDREAITDRPPADPAFADWPELYALHQQLAPVERRVLLTIAKRLLAGQASYGELGRGGDRRNLLAEALDEGLDLSVYLAAELERTR